uniref:Beta-defensin n=1 Tax=Otolemur garnettii TaxID=30611 RepID=H0XV57_OTOGA
MKFLYLCYLSLLFSASRSGKSCWFLKGHCKQNCKPSEQVKKPCKNGDYCCMPSKTESQPHRSLQAPTKKTQTFNNGLRENIRNL